MIFYQNMFPCIELLVINHCCGNNNLKPDGTKPLPEPVMTNDDAWRHELTMKLFMYELTTDNDMLVRSALT